ncbi:MAG: hypothetical protein CMI90_00445 [Pelagibacteraceae bacterium]|nr:hypothetical protein [Pelagibacteraceae bacterium]
MSILLSIIFLIIPSFSYSEDLDSRLNNDIQRLSNDLSDLQQFVYKNLDPSSTSQTTNKTQVTSSDKVSDIESSLKIINSRLEELEIKMSDIYSLFINQNKVTLSNVQSSDIVLEENKSTIVSENTQEKQLGKISLNEIDSNKIQEPEEKQILKTEDSEEIITSNKELTQQEEEIDIKTELIKAKNFMATLDNDQAINSLTKIISEISEDEDTIAEAYYWLGRTNFINSDYVESIKYFGIRHRDYPNIPKFKAENYFWLAKSLIQIGDNENACLVMEDIIFSNDYSEEVGIIEDSKFLQKDQNCGLIID